MKLDIYGDSNITVNKSNNYDGCSWNVSLNSYHSDNLNWIMTFRAEYEREKKLREDHPAIKNAWDQYQVIKTLAQKEQA